MLLRIWGYLLEYCEW